MRRVIVTILVFVFLITILIVLGACNDVTVVDPPFEEPVFDSSPTPELTAKPTQSPAPTPALEPVWKLVEQDKHYEIYRNEDNRFEYYYKIYNSEGKVAYDSRNSDVLLRMLEIEYISDDILSIHTSAGTYANQEWYYDIKKDNRSRMYDNPYMVFDGKIVFYKNGCLVVKDIFYCDGTRIPYERHSPCDFTTFSAPSSVELSDDKTMLTITHLKSDGFTEVTQTFEIMINSSYVSPLKRTYEFDISQYVNTRLPLVSGIGNAARTREINVGYDDIYNNAVAKVKANYDDDNATKWLLYDYDFDVVAETEDYISIKMFERGFNGWFHDFRHFWFDNYDIKTGRKLTLEDFLGDIPDWREKLEAELNAMNEKRGGSPRFENSMLDGRENTFYVENGNLHILYNEYEIASHDQGWIEFALPISALMS